MSRKFTYSDRKKLLALREEGLTYPQLKNRFNIKDDRTLLRHLKLAEQEHEARLLRIEILKDALSDHLIETRNLIDRWKSNIKSPPLRLVYYGMPFPTEAVKSDPLFNCLRQHLPFPTLWRNYSLWSSKVQEYIRCCQALMDDIMKKAKGSVSEDILNQWGTKSTVEALQLMEPLREMMADYSKLAESNPEVKKLTAEISHLEEKIHDALQTSLLRRDYIMYTCKLCPGQPVASG